MNTADLKRFLVAAALGAMACAFPLEVTAPVDGGPLLETPDAGPDHPCARCAGTCADDACVPAAVGEACDTTGTGTACIAGATCRSGVCRVSGCTTTACVCDALHCAGSCTGGACVSAEPGEACDLTGNGPGCGSGSCVSGHCTAPAAFEAVPAGEYLDVARSEFCRYLLRCEGWSPDLADSCADAIFPGTATFDSDAEALASAARGEAVYSAQAAGDCLYGFATISCRDPFPEACGNVFTGVAPLHSACTSAAHCGAGTTCVRDDTSGLLCKGLCEARVGVGGDCSERPCFEALTCVREGDQTAPVDVCRARTSPGREHAACGVGPQRCANGLYCSPATTTCERPHVANDLCDDAYACADGLTCALVDDFQRARCLPPRRRGESCVSNQQCSPLRRYVATDFCDGGVCAPLPSSGACVADEFLRNTCDPVLSNCQNGQCVPLARQNEPCLVSEDCGSLLGGMACAFGACLSPLSCSGTP